MTDLGIAIDSSTETGGRGAFRMFLRNKAAVAGLGVFTFVGLVTIFGPGIYGVEAAATHHFHTRPHRLTPPQASRLAAVLPAPKDWSASRPSRFIKRRARDIELRMERLGTRADCVLKDG